MDITTLALARKHAEDTEAREQIADLSKEIAEKAPAIVDEESVYFHSVVKNRNVSIEGNTFTRDTAKIVAGKNHVITLRTYDVSGVSLVAHDGRFLSMSGSLTADTQAIYLQAAKGGYTDSESIKGKRIRVVTKSDIAVSANGYNGAVPALIVRSGETKISTQYCDKTDIFNHDFFLDIPADAGEITLSLWYLESGVNLDGVEVFAGIYLADDTLIDTGATVENGGTLNVEIPQDVTEFDSMMHRSVQRVVVDTKEYIDSKTPENMLTYKDLQYLSPEMFGAVGDGVADDANAVQSCIDAAIASNLPVRGYGQYKCSNSVNIKCTGGDFYFHKLDISAGTYVLKLTGDGNRVRVDTLRAWGVADASGFRLETDADTVCANNHVSFGVVSSQSNAIEVINDFGESNRKYISYNRIEVHRAQSNNANIFYLRSNGYGCLTENSFWGRYMGCNNGYAVYVEPGEGSEAGRTNRFYEICCEHTTKNVAYGNVTLINPRVSDCLNDKTVGGDRGTLFKIVGVYPYASMFGEVGNYTAIDVSEAISFEQSKQLVAELLNAGASHGEAFFKAFGQHKMNFPVICEVDRLWTESAVEQFNSRHCPPGKIIAYFNHKGFVPNRPWRNSITTSEYRPFETDGRVPTIFEIDADTSIYLEDSYCCIGINEVTIVQKNGHKAKVYGKDYDATNPEASLIFDGTGLEDGTYKLHCEVAPFSLSVEYSGGVREYNEDSCEGLYFGSNDAWTVEKVNVLN